MHFSFASLTLTHTHKSIHVCTLNLIRTRTHWFSVLLKVTSTSGAVQDQTSLLEFDLVYWNEPKAKSDNWNTYVLHICLHNYLALLMMELVPRGSMFPFHVDFWIWSVIKHFDRRVRKWGLCLFREKWHSHRVTKAWQNSLSILPHAELNNKEGQHVY